MKGKPEVIKVLNERLAEEYAAHIQYGIHAATCKNWGYLKLYDYLSKRAADEKEHALELTDRILYLEGIPETKVSEIITAESVLEMFPVDKKSELKAVAGYIEGINIAVAANDFGTRKLLEHILEEEEAHLNDIDALMVQITQIGIEQFLSVQIGE